MVNIFSGLWKYSYGLNISTFWKCCDCNHVIWNHKHVILFWLYLVQQHAFIQKYELEEKSEKCSLSLRVNTL